jgi:hypothetical protein
MGKIEGWQAKTLSQARRTVLIKSTASSIPLYSMSTFILPDSTCNSLDKLFKKKKIGGVSPKERQKISLSKLGVQCAFLGIKEGWVSVI